MSDLGATPAEWYTFDFELGLGAHLLPCVPAQPDLKYVEGSSITGKAGKIPSSFDAMGLVHGEKAWQKRIIAPEEVGLWSRDRRLNICVRTGEISGVYAIDVDVEDTTLVARIHDDIAIKAGAFLPLRRRSNSNKFLLAFRMEGACPKRIITVVEADKARGLKPQRIELLGSGQQFVAAGTHSSGVRYEWADGLPTQLPTLTIGQLDTIWSTLTQFQVAGASPTPSPSTSPTFEGEQTVLTEISEDDWNSLIQALRHLLPYAADEQVWAEIGMALISIRHTRPAKQLWLDFSKKAPNWQEGVAESWWQAHTV